MNDINATSARWWAVPTLRSAGAVYLGRLVNCVPFGFLGLWSTLAIYYAYVPAWARILGAMLMLAATVASLFAKRRSRFVRVGFFALCMTVAAFHFARTATAHRPWCDQHAEAPQIEIDGRYVTIRNVRDFAWNGNGEPFPKWETRTYDLDQLQSLDLIITYFTTLKRVAHTCITFGFADGQYLNLSVEARRATGESYSPIAGLFRRYELIYVFATEPVALGSRLNLPKHELYLYPTRTPPDSARTLRLTLLNEANELRDHPRFYNTVFQNCTTTLLEHVNQIQPGIVPRDYRIWLNGRFDQLCYDLGWLDTDLPFDAARNAARINVSQILLGNDHRFSAAIRGKVH